MRVVCHLHGQSPKILASSTVVVQARLDDIGQTCQVGPSVCINDTLWTRSSPGSKRNGQHVIFIGALRLEAFPAFAALGLVILEALQDSLIKGATELAFSGVGILYKRVSHHQIPSGAVSIHVETANNLQCQL